MVAELPTCQNTLQGLAPRMRVTEAAEAVISVRPAWKTQTGGVVLPVQGQLTGEPHRGGPVVDAADQRLADQLVGRAIGGPCPAALL